ncbi:MULTISPECIES: AraC family transcriptional regulator [unclassified Pseudomonas]|uniref:AraC family transcriptional regulator n=1 Tax=unclassified Pseudomonas TaxID=196821 RepID=UPI000BD65D1F|nr:MULTISPECIES: AraC family transcriptional regulator [unclassified Pseudomonas]PVZ20479.1 AraC-like DNA-binding protein [Pseudomonas sp. URIL14HWK12:I12]PVZ27545.1 AraC-like DNA-binding protein [Pseudomonas sp. URIL14HWK12:I10]PVZ38434.1 AraC-like DNA-binding protein [Pseudomonas sp. URIL14HWK12:I11]SNZ03371.1 AraC-type DNA-binding protein [Pseudomonas sp. URIL14HWK12:I9]
MKTPVADRIRLPDAFWEGIRRVGLARADVVREARVPLAVIRDQAALSTAQFFALWQVLVELSGDPMIGLRIATGLESAVMPPSFMAAYHARDFRDALQRVARFKRLCAPEEVRIEEREDRSEIVVAWLHAEEQASSPALVDATLASLMELGRRGTATPLSALYVELARPEKNKADYERYFGCRVCFGAGRDCLTLRGTDLDKPFVSYNAELLDILIPELDRRLEQQSHSATLADQIRWVLRRRLTAGRPDIRSVATELAMSERSLQRKLTDEGLTFQSLLSETRHQLALEYLADPTLALIEVAYMLGYEDQNSFFRAFRQWEELTPAAWRSAALGKKAP